MIRNGLFVVSLILVCGQTSRVSDAFTAAATCEQAGSKWTAMRVNKVLIALALIAGCTTASRQPAPEASHFVCDQVQQQLCYVTTEADGRRRCERATGAVWSENGRCPLGIVAECRNNTETRYFYGDYPFDVAQASCTSPLIPPSH